jgi:hypothetical protein
LQEQRKASAISVIGARVMVRLSATILGYFPTERD